MILFLVENKQEFHLFEYRRNDNFVLISCCWKLIYFPLELIDCKHDLYIFWLIIFARYSLMIFLLIYFGTKMLRLFRIIVSNHEITLSCVKVIVIIHYILYIDLRTIASIEILYAIQFKLLPLFLLHFYLWIWFVFLCCILYVTC